MSGAPIGRGTVVEADGTLVSPAGRLALHVAGPCELVQRYLAGTPLLETVVVTATGATGVTDLLHEGELRRLVRRYTGAVALEVDGGREDHALRRAVLRDWFARLPADGELRSLSTALTLACAAEPGALRDPADVDELGLWRLPDGRADLAAHAAFAAR